MSGLSTTVGCAKPDDLERARKGVGGRSHLVEPYGTRSTGFTARVVSACAVVFAFVLLAFILWKAAQVLLLFFAGILLAVLLRSGTELLGRVIPWKTNILLTLMVILLLALGGVSCWLAAPGVAAQVTELSENLDHSVDAVRGSLRSSPVGQVVLEQFNGLTGDEGSGEALSRLGGIFSTTLGALSAVLIVVFSAFFLAYNPRLYLDGLVRLIPLKRRDRACEVIASLGMTLRWWLLGQMISMALLWISTWILLALLGVPLAFLLALLTGVLTFIPYLGPLIAAVPILLIAFIESPVLALYTFIGYMVIQNIEANVIMPMIFQRTVKVPAALTVGSQLLMAGLTGFVGILLATPLLAVAIVLVKMLYVEDALGDDTDKPIQTKCRG